MVAPCTVEQRMSIGAPVTGPLWSSLSELLWSNQYACTGAVLMSTCAVCWYREDRPGTRRPLCRKPQLAAGSERRAGGGQMGGRGASTRRWPSLRKPRMAPASLSQSPEAKPWYACTHAPTAHMGDHSNPGRAVLARDADGLHACTAWASPTLHCTSSAVQLATKQGLLYLRESSVAKVHR
jgi:hypothetical protein